MTRIDTISAGRGRTNLCAIETQSSAVSEKQWIRS
jgi:hypothetical protein